MNNTTASATYNAVAGYVEVTLSDGTIVKSKKGKNAAKALYVVVCLGSRSNPNRKPDVFTMQTKLAPVLKDAADLAKNGYDVVVAEVIR